jgi:hypothetical protein
VRVCIEGLGVAYIALTDHTMVVRGVGIVMIQVRNVCGSATVHCCPHLTIYRREERNFTL